MIELNEIQQAHLDAIVHHSRQLFDCCMQTIPEDHPLEELITDLHMTAEHLADLFVNEDYQAHFVDAVNRERVFKASFPID